MNLIGIKMSIPVLMVLLIFRSILLSGDIPHNELQTRKYKLPENFILETEEPQKILESYDIRFLVPGSGVVRQNLQEIIVTNTKDELEFLDAVIKAASPGSEVNFDVSLQLDCVSLKKADLPLLFGSHIGGIPKTTLSEDQIKILKKMIQDKKAFVAGTANLTTKPGQQGRVGATAEYNFPEGYSKLDGNNFFQPDVMLWETGLIFTVNPSVGADLKTMEISLVAELVTVKNDKKISLYVGGKEIQVDNPQFLVKKVETDIFSESGGTTLIGVTGGINPDKSEDPDSVMLFILKSQINII